MFDIPRKAGGIGLLTFKRRKLTLVFCCLKGTYRARLVPQVHLERPTGNYQKLK